MLQCAEPRIFSSLMLPLGNALKPRMHYCPSIIDVSRSPHAGWEDRVKGYATHSGLKGRHAVAQTHRRRTHMYVTIFLVVSSLIIMLFLTKLNFAFLL